VVSFTFYKYYILEDYYIIAETDCAPDSEKCFIHECDPALDSECPEAVADRVSYYKLIKKKAYNMPSCDGSAGCESLSCGQGEDCAEIICDESTKNNEDVCNYQNKD